MSTESRSKYESLLYLSVFLFGLITLATSTRAFSVAPHHWKPSNEIIATSFSDQILQPTITAIYTDHMGLLWIGTQQGLYRFDGATRVRYGTDTSEKYQLANSHIRGIAEDSDDNLVIATFGGGILRLNTVSGSFDPVHHKVLGIDPYLLEISKAPNGEIVVAGRSGIHLFSKDLRQHVFSVNRTDFELDVSYPYDLLIDQAGNIIVGSNSGLYIVRPGETNIEKLPLEQPVAGIVSITDLDRRRIIIATNDGRIIRYNLDTQSSEYSNRISAELTFSVSDILHFSDTVLIATDNGLFVTDTSMEQFQTFTSENSSLSNSSITRLYFDGLIPWIGTYQGLDRLSRIPLDLFNNKSDGIDNDVLSFAEDSHGNILVGTFRGLFIYKIADGEHFSLEESRAIQLRDERITTLATNQNRIWVGYQDNGFQILDTASNTTHTPDIPNIRSLAVTKIMHDGTDSTWIATYNRGLIRHKAGRYENITSIPEKSITILYRTESGSLFAASEQNVYKYIRERQEFELISLKFEATSGTPMILSIGESRRGDLLIGTKDKGLFVWPLSDQGLGLTSLVQFGSDKEIQSATVYGVLVDDTGTIWASTQNGLFALSPLGTIKHRLTKFDGLQGNDFNFGATFKDSIGQIYFGGVNGYNRFNPKYIGFELTKPEIILADLLLFGGDEKNSNALDSTRALELSHLSRKVSFVFSVLDFRNPEKNQFKYILEGFDTEWVESGYNNTATYTNLPPGEYTLRAQGANSAGIWNDVGLSLAVTVLPPPWKTWWAYCIYSVLLYAIARGCKRIYDIHMIKEQALVYAEQMHRTADRAEDDLQEYHETQDELVRSIYKQNQETLALMRQSFSGAEVSGPHFSRRLEALSILEECYFYQTDGLLANLRQFTDTLVTRRLPMATVAQEKICVINNVSENLAPAEIASCIALITDELLENSLLHGFTSEAPANYIQIDFNHEPATKEVGAFYRFCFKDNGVGTPQSVHQHLGKSSGLGIVYTLAIALDAQVRFTSKNGSSIAIDVPAP